MNNEKLEHPQNEKNSKLSRRQFIKIGSATLSITIVGAGLFKLLIPKQDKQYTIQASEDKPNKNPAFSFRRKSDGSAVCHTQVPSGKILQHELNDVGTEIYLTCDGKHNRNEITNIVAKKLNKDPRQFIDIVEKFLAELEKQNLIVTTGKVNLFYRTMVRYERT